MQDNQPTVRTEPPTQGGRTERVAEDSTRGLSTQMMDEPKTVLLDVEKKPPSLAWLVALDGIHKGYIKAIDPAGTVIGRDARLSQFLVDDDTVSREHAKVRKEPDARGNAQSYFVTDLGSGNKTFVNDKKVYHKALKDGDVIRVGQTRLMFKSAETPAKRPTRKASKRSGRKK